MANGIVDQQMTTKRPEDRRDVSLLWQSGRYVQRV